MGLSFIGNYRRASNPVTDAIIPLFTGTIVWFSMAGSGRTIRVPALG
jgi:hypothetical protein